MARYQENFTLDPNDIELIEHALREKIARHAVKDGTFDTIPESRAQVRQIDNVLGKIHNQKIFYAQVRAPGVPAG